MYSFVSWLKYCETYITDKVNAKKFDIICFCLVIFAFKKLRLHFKFGGWQTGGNGSEQKDCYEHTDNDSIVIVIGWGTTQYVLLL